MFLILDESRKPNLVGRIIKMEFCFGNINGKRTVQVVAANSQSDARKLL